MRKKLTLMMVALLSIAAFAATQMLNNISRRAGATVTYALSVGDTFTSGQTVEVKDGDDAVATITYGETDGNAFNAAVADSQVEGFTAYTAGNGTNGNKPGGTFYTIKPTYDGSIDVAVVLNADKAFYIEEDGTALADFNGITTDAKYYGTYSFNVSAGKSYKIYCAGSKLGFYGFKYTYTPASDPQDVTIAPADGTDISAALDAATGLSVAKSVTINLTEGASYTITKSIVASGDVVINGNGATIDASALTENMIQWAKKASDDTEWTKADIAISGVTVKGLKKALFYSGGKYYYGDFTLDNSVVELAADATTFDYTKGSTAVNFTVTNSTIYASTATTKSLYSSQGGQKTTEWDAEAVQTFKFTGNTMYNLAKSKNFFSHRQSNQKWLTYDVQNNIFVNCGKSGQTIKGMNGGSSGSNPTWIIKYNSFNFDGVDTSANEATGDGAEPVQNNILGVVAFANEDYAATGNFKLANCAQNTAHIGDSRWLDATVEPAPEDIVISAEAGANLNDALFNGTTAVNKKAKNITVNLVAGSYTIIAPIEASANVTINGDDAAIDASALNGAFIVLDGTEEFAKKADGTDSDHKLIGAVTVKDVTIKGMKGAFIKDNQKTLLQKLTVDNSVIEMPASNKNFIDFNGKGYVGEVKVQNSTIWAADKNTGFFAQYGSRPKNVNGDWLQVFDIQNSDIINIANGKNLCDLKQNGTEQNVYTLKKNIFVDCGKNGQTVVGFNKGQASATPQWDVTGNTFVWGGECTNEAEISKAGQKDGADIVKKCLDGVPVFANEDYATTGNFKLANCVQNTVHIGDPRWLDATAEPTPEDIVLSPEPGAELSTTLFKATTAVNKKAKSITFNLGFYSEYIISEPITAGVNINIKGNNSIIDASALNDPFIVLDGTEKFAKKADGTDSDHKLIDAVTVHGVIIKGMKGAFIKDEQKTLLQKLTVDNNVIEMPASNKNFIDFNGKGYVGEVKVQNSTIWAADKNTGFFAQYGSRPKNVNSDWLQVFDVQNSDIINIANGKNLCDLKQNGTAQNVYTLKNNIFVDCGKNGQTVVGFNKGQTSATPQWDVTGNSFVWGGECTNDAEISKAGQKAGADIVQNCVNGVPEFADAAKGDFTFGIGSKQQKYETGDPRWLTYYDPAFAEVENVNLTLTDGAEISSALAKYIYEKGIDKVGQIIILLETGNYTIENTIEAPNTFVLAGLSTTTERVKIDASELNGPFVQMSKEPTLKTNEKGAFVDGRVTFMAVDINNLKQQLVYANKTQYLMEGVGVFDCVIGIDGTAKKTIFDFNGGGNTKELLVSNSTIWANPTNGQNGGFFSSQSSKDVRELDETATQTFTITNNTLYNITYGKTANTLRKNSQEYQKFIVANNIIVNCGKSNQFLKGLNAGQAGKDVNWEVDGNVFNFDGAISEEQQIGSTADNIKNTINVLVQFKDAENGDFTQGYVKDTEAGDPRWYDENAVTAIETVKGDAERAADGAWYTIQGVRVDKPSKGVFIHNGKKVVVK